jgi:hypothetical protein
LTKEFFEQQISAALFKKDKDPTSEATVYGQDGAADRHLSTLRIINLPQKKS